MSIVAYTQRVIDRSFYFCSHINCKDILLQALTRVLCCCLISDILSVDYQTQACLHDYLTFLPCLLEQEAIERVCDDCTLFDSQSWKIENISCTRKTCTFLILKTTTLPSEHRRSMMVTIYTRRQYLHHYSIYIMLEGFIDKNLIYYRHSPKATTLSTHDYIHNPQSLAFWLRTNVSNCVISIATTTTTTSTLEPAIRRDDGVGARPRFHAIKIHKDNDGISELIQQLTTV